MRKIPLVGEQTRNWEISGREKSIMQRKGRFFIFYIILTKL